MPFPIATGLMNKRNSSISPNLITLLGLGRKMTPYYLHIHILSFSHSLP
jgi:hypothetical protein